MDNPDMTPPQTPPPDESELNTGLDARIEAEMDKRGISYALARAAITGEPGDLFSLPAGTAQPPRSPAAPRRSRRGGRSLPEVTARDLAAAHPYEQPSADEIAKRQDTTRDGMQTVARQMGPHNFDHDVKTAERLGISVQAATQLRLDKERRRRGA